MCHGSDRGAPFLGCPFPWVSLSLSAGVRQHPWTPRASFRVLPIQFQNRAFLSWPFFLFPIRHSLLPIRFLPRFALFAMVNATQIQPVDGMRGHRSLPSEFKKRQPFGARTWRFDTSVARFFPVPRPVAGETSVAGPGMSPRRTALPSRTAIHTRVAPRIGRSAVLDVRYRPMRGEATREAWSLGVRSSPKCRSEVAAHPSAFRRPDTHAWAAQSSSRRATIQRRSRISGSLLPPSRPPLSLAAGWPV
jgi:hypothetical protein